MIQVIEFDRESKEHCVFCRKLTAFWFRSKRTRDVACCTGCASRANESDVPTKDEWLKRERIAVGRFY